MSRNKREGVYVGSLDGKQYRQKKEVIDNGPHFFDIYPSRKAAFDTFWYRPIKAPDDPEIDGARFLRN